MSATKGRRPSSKAVPAEAPPVNAMGNEDVAAAFEEMADLLAIAGDNPFRVRAYERAAQVVRSLPRPLATMGGPAQWDALPGIGSDLAAKIDELQRTGQLRSLVALRRKVPAGLRELLRIPGVGPARVRLLQHAAGVKNLDDLRHALTEGKLTGIRGLGPALVEKLRAALARTDTSERRWLWPVAHEAVVPLCKHLRSVAGVTSVDVAGSLRRGRDTVGDLDIVVCGRGAIDLGKALRSYPGVATLTATGETRCTAILSNALQVDVRLVTPADRGAALYYLTGSRDHNLQLRQRAIDQGLKLNEYGLYRGSKRIAGKSEQELLGALGLAWIPPELRENRGEIEAASQARIPRLIEVADLRGDLHAHTTATDGRDTLEAMATAARAFGLSYMAVTDHSAFLGMVHGLDASRLERQLEQIDAYNASTRDFCILKGCEVDILEDGRLALPTAVLRKLEVVVVAVHSHFGLDPKKQTDRIIRALEHPCTTILGHPTGRLLNRRPPYRADYNAIIAAAARRRCYLEIDSQPDRLDLDEFLAKAAQEQGVLLSVASDAHSAAQFSNLDAGIRQARRAWLRREDVINTRPLPALRKLLARTRS